MVVEAEEDAIRILNVGDPMAVPRRPHVLLHELRKLRIVFHFATVWRLTQSFFVAGETPRVLSRSSVSGTLFTRTSKWSSASPGTYGVQNGLRSAYQFSSTRWPERRSRNRTYLPSSSPPRSISSRSNTWV